MTDEQVDWFKNAPTEAAWNEACDRVKKIHGGYPADWYPRIIMSGIAARAQARFGK